MKILIRKDQMATKRKIKQTKQTKMKSSVYA